MSDQDYATVSGEKVHRSDFAYAPAGSEPHEWKLPIHDASHVRNALARFNQTELPPDKKAEVHAKIMRAARKFGIDAGDKRQETRDERRASRLDLSLATRLLPLSLAVLLTSEGTPVETPADVVTHRSGAQLREIAVAVPGSWVKGDHNFSITKQDIADMVRNFEKRKNDMIVIDYEHASEQPEVAKGGPVPGAGWIHKLQVSGSRFQVSGEGPDTWHLTPGTCLSAFVEWTPQAEEMLRTGQYRFFSPAIDWGATDKETGEPQGATLTSGALTNHPFLEELPPIMLSDGTVITRCSGGLRPPNAAGAHGAPLQKGAMTMSDKEEKDKKKEKLEDPEEKLRDKEAKDDDGDDETLSSKHELPMLKIRKGRKGSKHEGHHILSDGGTDVGCMSEEDLRAHAKAHLGVNPDEAEDKERASESRRRSLILTEVAREGKVDAKRATELADKGKITFADYIRATEAEKMIDAAVREGRILPRDRKFFFRDALERPEDFAEYLKGARAVTLGSQGFGSAERGSPDEEIDLGVKKLMRDSKLDYASAFKQFLTENPVLADTYRRKHSQRVNADGTAN